MDLVAESINEDTKRKKLQVLKNVSFDSREIAVISGIAYFVMTGNTRCLFGFKFPLFGHCNLQRKPHFRHITEVHFQE